LRLSAADHGDAGGARGGRGIVGVQENQVPTQKNQQRQIGPFACAGLDFNCAFRLDDAMPAFEPNYRLILVQPDPFRLPEIRRCQFQRVSISDFERAAAGPARMKRGDVGLGIGQGAPLEAQATTSSPARSSCSRLRAAGWIHRSSWSASSAIPRTSASLPRPVEHTFGACSRARGSTGLFGG